MYAIILNYTTSLNNRVDGIKNIIDAGNKLLDSIHIDNTITI